MDIRKQKPKGSFESQQGLFFKALKSDEHIRMNAEHVAVVIAHPDDETIGLGGSFTRLSMPLLILVTEGAPKSPKHAQIHGFASPSEYSNARLAEFKRAAALAGIPESRLVRLNFSDQTIPFNLTALTMRLVDLFVTFSISVAVTHSYEGGHQDHDGVAFAVHQAAAIIAARDGIRPAIIEMPFYRRSRMFGVARQRFAPASLVKTVTVRLDRAQRAQKRSMYAAHETQGPVLRKFGSVVEKFRVAPNYDFTQLPNNGLIHYESFSWSIRGDEWAALVKLALKALESSNNPPTRSV